MFHLQGSRLNAQARHVRLTTSAEDFAQREKPISRSLPDVCALSIREAAEFFESLELDATGANIAEEALKEIRGRLGFLLKCGLDYLALDRTAPTLSGGETQRIRLAGQIGCGLVGVVYILDEPSIGLHPRDNVLLLESLQDLRDQGNTVIVVEHDEDTMRAADHHRRFRSRSRRQGRRSRRGRHAGQNPQIPAKPDGAISFRQENKSKFQRNADRPASTPSPSKGPSTTT